MAANLDAKFERIISQQMKFDFGSLGLAMMMTRMIGKYKANPTAEVMKGCIAEINAFVAKYESVLEKDLKDLSTK